MILIFGSVLTKQFLFVGCEKSSLFSPLTPVHSRPLNSPATIWKTFLAFTTIFISDFSLFYLFQKNEEVKTRLYHKLFFLLLMMIQLSDILGISYFHWFSSFQE